MIKDLPVIVLASASPRRDELLSASGIPHEILITDADENPSGPADDGMTYAEWYARENSRIKDKEAQKKLSGRSGHIVSVSADTIVTPDNRKIYGKPKDENDAYDMLMALSGKEHYVVGGVTVSEYKDGNCVKTVSGVCSTKVVFRNLDRESVRSYIESGEPFGKAGAYAIQSRGALFIESVEGDYPNIVGLSVSLVERIVSENFGFSLCDYWNN